MFSGFLLHILLCFFLLKSPPIASKEDYDIMCNWKCSGCSFTYSILTESNDHIQSLVVPSIHLEVKVKSSHIVNSIRKSNKFKVLRFSVLTTSVLFYLTPQIISYTFLYSLASLLCWCSVG